MKMKKQHAKTMHKSHKMHHSDPIVGGESEREGRVMGHGEFANMSHAIKMTSYPKGHEFGADVLDDTMGEIDMVNSRAHKKTRSNISNQH